MTRDRSSGEVETRGADPGARRRLLVVLAIALLLGGVAIAIAPLLIADLLNSESTDPVARGVFLVRGLGLLLAAALLAPAVYLWMIAVRTDTAAEFPPPGMTLVRDARVLRGDAARGRAWLLRAIAIKLVLMAVAAVALTWILAGTLIH